MKYDVKSDFWGVGGSKEFDQLVLVDGSTVILVNCRELSLQLLFCHIFRDVLKEELLRLFVTEGHVSIIVELFENFSHLSKSRDGFGLIGRFKFILQCDTLLLKLFNLLAYSKILVESDLLV